MPSRLFFRGHEQATFEHRFFEKCWYDPSTGCIEWMATHDRHNYGRFCIGNGRMGQAARVAYEMARGPIPAVLHIDHLCRNHPCVNPEHLEAVMPRENTRRGTSPTAIARRTNRCMRGHDLDGANAHVRPLTGYRRCRPCHNAWARRSREKGRV